jgi:hypothetical protein
MKIDKKQFNRDIMQIYNRGDITLLEALVEYCRINEVEEETVSKLLDKNVKSRLEAEANTFNLLTDKTRHLPL